MSNENTTLQVLNVTHSVSRNGGGIFFAVRQLSQALHKCGLSVDVAGIHDRYFEEDKKEWSPISPRAYLPLGPHALGFAPAMYRDLIALAGRRTVFHLHGLWKATSHACLHCAKKTGSPLMVSPHGMLDAWAVSQSRPQKALAGFLYESRNLRKANCLHALNAAELGQIRAYGLSNPVAIIPNGVDLPVEDPAQKNTAVEPDDWKNKNICLFMSRIHEKKGLIPLIEAFAAASGEHEDWVLAIAGPDDGGHLAAVEEAIMRFNAPARIRWIGPITGECKDRWLRRADAFVLPSFSEGLPIAALEAFAYRLPVLMTDACNLPDAFEAGAAIRIQPDPQSLQPALGEFFKLEAETRIDMGLKGRRLVESSYTWHEIAEHMVSVYRWLLDGGTAPPAVHEE